MEIKGKTGGNDTPTKMKLTSNFLCLNRTNNIRKEKKVNRAKQFTYYLAKDNRGS